MRSKKLVLGGIGVVMLAMGLGYVVDRARAAGIPTMAPVMTYAGTLSDTNGVPLTGSKNILVEVWATATGGTTPVCITTSSAVTLVAGTFQIALPDTCTAAVHANGDLWVEVLVDGASLGRTKMGAVPYAVESGHATSADSATSATGALKAAVDTLQSHDINISKKGGDNGTVNCTTYCTGDPWATVGAGRGTCVAAYNTSTQKYVGCDDAAPGLLPTGNQLTCWCSQPAP